MANISFYGSHNGSYVVEKNGKIELLLEIERFLNYKNSLKNIQLATPKGSKINCSTKNRCVCFL